MRPALPDRSFPDHRFCALGDLAPGRYFLRVGSPGERIRIASVTLIP